MICCPFLKVKEMKLKMRIGQKLNWNPNPDNRDKVILLQYSTDFTDNKKLNEALDWMVEYTIKFRQTFSKIVKEFPR